MLAHPSSINSANGIRTRVWALRGPRPSPLDDSAAKTKTSDSRPVNRRSFDRSFPKASHRPGRNRTCNPRFWRPVLYQLSYGPTPAESRRTSQHIRGANHYGLRTTANCGQLGFVRNSEFVLDGWLTGIEPATPGATDRCSNQLSYSHHCTKPTQLRKTGCLILHLNRVLQSNQQRRHRSGGTRTQCYFARSMYSPVFGFTRTFSPQL